MINQTAPVVVNRDGSGGGSGGAMSENVASMRALSESKGWPTVAKFIEEMASVQGGRSELLETLAMNGYEGSDTLDALFITLTECRASVDPTGYLQSHLNAGHGLRSGHAQKLIARFTDLMSQVQVVRNLQMKFQ